MFERIVARLVEHAMPPDIEDPDQERIAQDAAANGIRQAGRVAGIAGGILCVVVAAALFMYFVYFPRQRVSPEPSEATRAAPQARAEANAMLRQAIEDLQKRLDIYIPLLRISQEPSEATRAAPEARAEDSEKLRQWIKHLQKQLADMTKERDTLQGKVAALEGQVKVAGLNSRLQAAKAEAAPKLRQPNEELQKQLADMTKERDTLQGKVAALEGQVAGLNTKLQAAKVLAAPKVPPEPAQAGR